MLLAGVKNTKKVQCLPVDPTFGQLFTALTSNPPFPWQQKLYDRFVADRPDNIPSVADLPTGLGKTSVIAIWLAALITKPMRMPRRLIYVVNRRTVVDQTTAEVESLRRNLSRLGSSSVSSLGVSTLRGQFADNREWSQDPTRPAVVCGTVDLIGSRLLFEGYRIGFRSRPMHAAFLGQDALLIHDEAHLEPAFQRLIETIEEEQRKQRLRNGELPWPGFRVMALSATARETSEETGSVNSGVYDLTPEEKEVPSKIPDPPREPIHHVWRRLSATKTVSLREVETDKEAPDSITELALQHKDTGLAVMVFVRTLDTLESVYKRLTDRQKGVPRENVQQLTGTMRGFERDQLVSFDPVFARFMPQSDRPKDLAPAEGTVYLICTSAGEVGVNLSADHMVCDLSTFDSMSQRLGRVNRFGDRTDTRVDVVYPKVFDDKSMVTPARKATLALFQELHGDGSPRALGHLPADKRLAAFAPAPTILPATDILFDAWALTTVRGIMPGRPPVAPYLHGVADDLPQTTIVWRAELDLIDLDSADATEAVLSVLTSHRVRPHEMLTTSSYRVETFLKSLKKRKELHSANIVLHLPYERRLMKLGELLADLRLLKSEPTIVLPASFGGLDERGTLSTDSVTWIERIVPAGELESLDVADRSDYEPYENVPARIRVLIQRSEDGWSVEPLPGGELLPGRWELETRYATSTDLVNAIRQQSGLNVRLLRAIEKNADGEDIRALVCLAAVAPTQGNGVEQSLDEHVALVVKEAERIAEELALPEPFRSALLFAAAWHDEGKRAPIWQRYIGGPGADGGPLGKSAKWRNPKLLASYRHEFGTLLRLTYPGQLQTQCDLPTDPEVKDLALHLIAAHHGYARPHFAHTIVEGFSNEQEEAAQLETIHRYARLQRTYGRWGLAYLESLLRAADATASRGVGVEPGVDEEIEGDAT